MTYNDWEQAALAAQRWEQAGNSAMAEVAWRTADRIAATLSTQAEVAEQALSLPVSNTDIDRTSEPKGHWEDGGKVWVEDHDFSLPAESAELVKQLRQPSIQRHRHTGGLVKKGPDALRLEAADAIENISTALAAADARIVYLENRLEIFKTWDRKGAEELDSAEKALAAADARIAELDNERDASAREFVKAHDVMRQRIVDAEDRAETAETLLEEARRALTPSAETKAAYMGEFWFERTYTNDAGNELGERIYVPWDTIKEIMKAISLRALLKEKAK